MMSAVEIGKILKEKGMFLASERTASLFLLSCVGLAYSKILQSILGISYAGIGGFGNKNGWKSLFNEPKISKDTEFFLKKNHHKFDEKFFNPVNLIFDETARFIVEIQKIINTQPYNALEIITQIFPKYLGALSAYNCLWRYIGNREQTEFFSRQEIQELAKERTVKAEFYPKIEAFAKFCVEKIGKEQGFDGSLLMMATLKEMKTFIKTKRISKKLLNVLSERSKGFFYLYVNSKEQVFTDKKVLQYVEQNFLSVSNNVTEVKGYSAFAGKICGIVCNLSEHKSTEIPEGCVLVTSMTHPKEMHLISKCVAIVTNEGGVLSHASIIARELKKPCIIGTKIATKVFKDGDLVEVNADKGVVRKLK